MGANISKPEFADPEVRHFRTIADVLPEPMMLVTAQGTVLAANLAAASLFGVNEGRWSGQPFAQMVAGSEQTALGVLRVFARSRSLSPQALVLRTADGRELPYRCDGALCKPAHERSPAVLLLRFSPRGTASSQFRLLNEKIAQLSAEVHKRRQSEAALELENQHKQDFLYMLAHELRNPLAPLRNAVELVKRQTAQKTEMQRLTHTMERQIRHLVLLLDDLLDVARISRGTFALQFAPVSLGELMESAAELGVLLTTSAELTLEVERPIPAATLSGDMTRLLQVLSNLISNAVKFSQPGGKIILSVTVNSHEARITVRDEGVGIDAVHLPRIFEKFFQVDRSLDRSRGGLGLGLALSRAIVERHGGHVQASSAGPGTGSEFLVVLPLAPAEDESLLHGASPHPRPALDDEHWQPNPESILLVDDNDDAAQTLGAILELWGLKVRIARDGNTALAAVNEDRPAVVLLDIGLPGMSGYELARRIRAVAGMEHATLIAVTGYGDSLAQERSRQAGIDHHLPKPVDLDQIRSLLAAR